MRWRRQCAGGVNALAAVNGVRRCCRRAADVVGGRRRRPLKKSGGGRRSTCEGLFQAPWTSGSAGGVDALVATMSWRCQMVSKDVVEMLQVP